jgi:hypothetical protein
MMKRYLILTLGVLILLGFFLAVSLPLPPKAETGPALWTMTMFPNSAVIPPAVSITVTKAYAPNFARTYVRVPSIVERDTAGVKQGPVRCSPALPRHRRLSQESVPPILPFRFIEENGNSGLLDVDAVRPITQERGYKG